MEPSIEVRKKLAFLKWQGVVSGLMFWGGLVWLFVAMVGLDGPEPRSQLRVQLLLIAIGFVWYLYIRFRVWLLTED